MAGVALPGDPLRVIRARVVQLSLIAVAALSLVACGGSGDGQEGAIQTSVERFFAHDPRGCDLQTRRFLLNSEDEVDPRAALRQCRERESGNPATAGLAPSRGASVSEIAVDSDRAEADARLEGGDVDAQVIHVTLAKQGDAWKIDRLDGLTIDPTLREKLDALLRPTFRSALRGKVPDVALVATVDCVVAGGRRAIPNPRLAARFEGQLAPGTLGRAFEDVTRRCLEAGV
jgi:hypothetical protein